MEVPGWLREMVVSRANARCEYCGLSQAGQEAVFHIDHIRPVVAKGETELENLALACVSCSLRKGAREKGADSESGKIERLYHPREDRWDDHFRWDQFAVVGKSGIGRASVALLKMNRQTMLAIREEEAHWGRHPPPQT